MQAHERSGFRRHVLDRLDAKLADAAISKLTVQVLKQIDHLVAKLEVYVTDSDIVVQDVHFLDSVIKVDRARIPFHEIWGHDLVQL